jgi:hypothetical protein
MRAPTSTSGAGVALCALAGAMLVACTLVSGVDDLVKVPAPSGDTLADAGAGAERRNDDAGPATAPAEGGSSVDASVDHAAGDAALPPCGGGGPGCDAAVDAAPTTQTFRLARDCNGGYCRGGYDGVKDDTEIATATKQCQDRSFARATAFTIGGEPGGDFCSYASGSYHCDGSCSGCDMMLTITCATP